MKAQADDLPTEKRRDECDKSTYGSGMAARGPMVPYSRRLTGLDGRLIPPCKRARSFPLPFPIQAGDCSAADWIGCKRARRLLPPFHFRISESSGMHDIS